MLLLLLMLWTMLLALVLVLVLVRVRVLVLALHVRGRLSQERVVLDQRDVAQAEGYHGRVKRREPRRNAMLPGAVCA